MLVGGTPGAGCLGETGRWQSRQLLTGSPKPNCASSDAGQDAGYGLTYQGYLSQHFLLP